MSEPNHEIVIYATVQSVTCPNCGEELRGFVQDPRKTTEPEACEACGEFFKVPQDARIELS